MRVLVIGLGSMGKRRIRLLKKINLEIEIMGVDTNVDRMQTVSAEYGIDVCGNLSDALETYGAKCAIISTAPLSHGPIIKECLSAGLHVFTELNLVSDYYHENMQLAKDKEKTLFLSSTFLYRDEVNYVMRRVEESTSKLNYTYHVGQYLPDWHPWEQINNFFVGDKRTNGCRELFAIELPWIIKTFGKVVSYKVVKSQNTSLNIDYADNYLVMLEHETGHKGMLAVDVMSRKAVRNLEVYGENLYLAWDGSPYGLKEYNIENKQNEEVKIYSEVDTIEGYSSFIIENAYQKELETFFAVIEGAQSARYSFEEDLEIIQLMDAIEE